jgi:flagellar basal body-associated protein FliL
VRVDVADLIAWVMIVVILVVAVAAMMGAFDAPSHSGGGFS